MNKKKYMTFGLKNYEAAFPWMEGFNPYHIDTVRLFRHLASESKAVHELEHAAGISTAQISQTRHPELRIAVVGIRWLGEKRTELARVMEQATGSRMCIDTATDETWSHSENFLRDVRHMHPDLPSAVQAGALASYRDLRTVAFKDAMTNTSGTSEQRKLDGVWHPAPEYLKPSGLVYLRQYYEEHDRPHPFFPVFISYAFDRLAYRRQIVEEKVRANAEVAEAKERREALEAKYAARPRAKLPDIKLDFDF